MNSNAFKSGNTAYKYAVANGYTTSNLYVVVDYTKPSTEKRFYIVDASTNTVIYSTYVAHGSGSGHGNYVEKFSNNEGSNATSIGVMQVGEMYQGAHGTVYRMKGLEKGYNDNVYSRFIEIHGAAYIGYGRTGHSWGCFAVPSDQIEYVLGTLKPGMIVVSYGNDTDWLKNSRFLN